MPQSDGPSAALTLDRANECVHQGDRQVKLTPKAFAVLRHLIERPGQLATKDELMAAVWPDTVVTEASLSTCINEIRRALHDDPGTPRYIQTVHRRGYRYIGQTREEAPPAGIDGIDLSAAPRPSTPRASAPLVGRDRELSSLARSLRQAEGGERRLVLVGGETGIGKTALVGRFAADAADRGTALIAQGQCVEQYGACEPYLPWFDVLNHLARACGPARLATLLRRCAPMWLAQLPWLIAADERQQLQHEIAGVTRERMIRELAAALDALGAEQPVVVIVEDLQWSDPSSIGLLAYLARQPQSGRLLLIGTYRPTDLYVTSHPLMALKHELLLHGACEDLVLGFLTTEAVAEYVRLRLPGAPEELAALVHRRTDGNALFMVTVIDDLLARGALVQDGDRWRLRGTVDDVQTLVPESLRELIERQLDRLTQDDRRVLEAASVAGAAGGAAAVAAALAEPIEMVEERLGALARRGSFVRGAERQVWPDGTQGDGYEFIQGLYQHVLYDRIGTNRRSRMHRQIGERLEAGYGDRAQEIAAELALHFQRGRDSWRAIRHLAQAGENAIRHSAYVEAIALLTHGLGLLSTLPEGPDRDACEVRLQAPLGVSYMNTRGYAAPEVGAAFTRAHALCLQLPEQDTLFRVLRGVYVFSEQRGDLRKAQSLAGELLRLAERDGDPARLVEAHRINATAWFHRGNFAGALEHVQQGLTFYDGQNRSSRALPYGQDSGVFCFAWQAWTQWYLGFPDRAAASARRGIELARQIGHPFTLAYINNFAAQVYLCRGEPAAAEVHAGEGLRCAREHGLTLMLAMGQILQGWSRTLMGSASASVSASASLAEIEEGLALWRSTGARLMTPYWMCLLASALDRAGRTTDASRVMHEALREAEQTDERWFECELYLLKASLSARGSHGGGHGEGRRAARAEILSDLRRALAAGNATASPALRLRAATALSRHMLDGGSTHEARDLVDTAYAQFSEGFQTADLVNARSMLAQL